MLGVVGIIRPSMDTGAVCFHSFNLAANFVFMCIVRFPFRDFTALNPRFLDDIQLYCLSMAIVCLGKLILFHVNPAISPYLMPVFKAMKAIM